MRARQLIEGATFNCETLAVLGKAFDMAWIDIADHFAGNEEQIDRARMRLAHAVLIVADDNCRDVERTKNEALQILALTFSDPQPVETFVRRRVRVA